MSSIGPWTGCAATKWGPAIGARYSYKFRVEHGSGAVPGSLSYTCIDSPHFVDTTIKCAVSVGPGVIVGPPDPRNPTTALVSIPRRPTAFAAGGMRDPGLCATSYTVEATANAVLWGRYQGSAEAVGMTCTRRRYTTPGFDGVTPPPEVRGCSGPYTVSAQVRGTLACDGWQAGWPEGYRFSADDCPGGGGRPQTIRCDVSGPPVAVLPERKEPDGSVREEEVVTGGQMAPLGDGSTWQVTWPRPTITGASRIHSATTLLVREENGTPWHPGRPLTEQPVVADFQARSGLLAGPWAHQWLQSGFPDRPSVHRLHYTVDADWPTETATVTGIDLLNATFDVRTSRGTVRAEGRCITDPLTVDLHAPRLTSN